MSAHGLQSRSRAPNPKTFEREPFPFGHCQFEVADNPRDAITFGIYVGDPLDPKRRAIVTGLVKRGMATQLRRLAHRLDELEAKLPMGDVVDD